jgi:hypothetical protein
MHPQKWGQKISEVVDVLSIRDLNTLCRIHEMRKEQIIALEERRERFKKMRESLW